MTPDETKSYVRPLYAQINSIQSNLNCGMFSVEAMQLYLESLGYCCKNLRENESA